MNWYIWFRFERVCGERGSKGTGACVYANTLAHAYFCIHITTKDVTKLNQQMPVHSRILLFTRTFSLRLLARLLVMFLALFLPQLFFCSIYVMMWSLLLLFSCVPLTAPCHWPYFYLPFVCEIEILLWSSSPSSQSLLPLPLPLLC